MVKRVIVFCLILAFCWLAGPDAFGQRFGRRGRGPGRRPSEMTDADREAMYGRMVEHYHEHFVQDYELTDEQSQAAKAQLEAIKAAHRAYIEPLREEFQRTGQEMRELFRKRRAGEEVDWERMDEIMDRMREMREASPLMNRESVTEQVEALLPAKQVEKGRARAQQQREERRQRWEGDRGQRGDRRRGGRDGFRRRGERFSFRSDRWDRYYADFNRRYQLDSSQSAMAESILRELKERRDQYMQTHQEEFDALRLIEDREKRSNAYRELSAPADALFNRLREKLGQIPTRAQTAAGGTMPEYWNRDRFSSRLRGPSTRPANTRPASSTTQPADG